MYSIYGHIGVGHVCSHTQKEFGYPYLNVYSLVNIHKAKTKPM